MAPSTRNTVIYVLIAACALILASRIVTVGLLLSHAPEDAEPGFYLRQFVISALSVGAILWLWNRRNREQESGNGK
jgi:hypothetical protein